MCEVLIIIALLVGSARFLHVSRTYAIRPSQNETKPLTAEDTFKTFTAEQLRGTVIAFAEGQTQNKNNIVVTKTTVPITHYELPSSDEIRAIYMTSWVGSTLQKRKQLIDFVDRSPVINAIIVDLKDETGVISVPVPKDSPLYPYANENKQVRIPDIKSFVEDLHSRGIYVIGRIAVFQDNIYTQKIPESAIQNSVTKKPWKDRKNVSWIDPGYKPTWDYVLNIARLGKSYGFDEINYDYVRYPTETSSAYSLVFNSSGEDTKRDVIEAFFKHINKGMKEEKLTSSVDIFGLLTTEDDIGIGQNLSIALDNFDYVAPMIYPSHYTSGSLGIKDPDSHPFETITKVMQDAYDKSELTKHEFRKIRPWIQDFTLKHKYGVKEVSDQLRAVSLHGTKGFMVWSPNNVYTEKAYTAFGDDLVKPAEKVQ